MIAIAETLELFQYAFLQRALMAALLIAVLAGVLGVFIVLRGMALLGDGLAHMSLAGVGIGLALGIYPLGVALVVAVVGGIAIHLLQTHKIVKSDTAIGILFTAGLAIGILVVSAGPGINIDLHAYLFGDLLAVRTRDLLLVTIVGSVLLVLLVLLRKELMFVTFDHEAARVAGLPVAALDIAFTSVAAAGIVVAIRIVGILLVSALLIVPAAAALQLARSFRAALIGAVAFGVTSAAVGIWLSAAYSVVPGAAIAVVAVGLFVGSVAIGRGLGRTG